VQDQAAEAPAIEFVHKCQVSTYKYITNQYKYITSFKSKKLSSFLEFLKHASDFKRFFKQQKAAGAESGGAEKLWTLTNAPQGSMLSSPIINSQNSFF